MSLGVGDELLGQAVKERRINSVLTAAQATGVDQRRLRKMLAAVDIVRNAESGLSDAWEVFDAELAKPILDELTTLVDAKAFAALIGATRSQFDMLVKDGVLVKFVGEFPFHKHDTTDDFFYVLEGEMQMDIEGGPSRAVRAGELFIVPKGVVHRPRAKSEVKVLLIEPKGEPNSGDSNREAAPKTRI